MATRTGTIYQYAFSQISNTGQTGTADLKAPCQQIKQEKLEKQIKSELIEDYENSASSSENIFQGTDIKTEPGINHNSHYGNQTSSRFFDQDPYSDDVIFMGITNTRNSSHINSKILNFTIKTEKPEYFETDEGVIVINDDEEENGNTKTTDFNTDQENNVPHHKADKAKNKLSKGDSNAKTSTNKSTSGISGSLTAATDALGNLCINERASETTERDALEPSTSSDQYQSTSQSTQTDPISFDYSNKTVKLHRNGKEHYLQYLKDPIYNKEFILIYIKTNQCIRLFSKEFEPQHFYTSFHDWATLPETKPEQWLDNLLCHYQKQVLNDIPCQQYYMESFDMKCSKMVLYYGCLLWRIRRHQDAWIVMQELQNCENVAIYCRDNAEFKHLEHVFWKAPNYRYQLSDMDVNYRYLVMKRHFFQ